MKYEQSRKKLFCPWTDDVHGQLSTIVQDPKEHEFEKTMENWFNFSFNGSFNGFKENYFKTDKIFYFESNIKNDVMYFNNLFLK